MGTPDFKRRGWSKDVLGFYIFDSGIFWVGKFGKYFFVWLDLRGDLSKDFFGFSKQSEDSCCLRKYNQTCFAVVLIFSILNLLYKTG